MVGDLILRIESLRNLRKCVTYIGMVELHRLWRGVDAVANVPNIGTVTGVQVGHNLRNKLGWCRTHGVFQPPVNRVTHLVECHVILIRSHRKGVLHVSGALFLDVLWCVEAVFLPLVHTPCAHWDFNVTRQRKLQYELRPLHQATGSVAAIQFVNGQRYDIVPKRGGLTQGHFTHP